MKTVGILAIFMALIFAVQAEAATLLWYESTPDSVIGQGRDEFITPEDGFSFSPPNLFLGNNREWLAVGVSGYNVLDEFQSFSFLFAPPQGQVFQIGLYTGVLMFPHGWTMYNPAMRAVFDLRGGDLYSVQGEFEIREYEVDSNGYVESLRLRFDLNENDDPNRNIRGEYLYNAPEPTTPVLLLLTAMATLLRRRRE
jgi:hypothetical protein